MNFEEMSVLFKALGHPLRLQIIARLLRGKCCVNDISRNLNTPQSTISQHLSILRNAGIIHPVKEGVRSCYQVINGMVKKIMELEE